VKSVHIFELSKTGIVFYVQVLASCNRHIISHSFNRSAVDEVERGDSQYACTCR
jgi:hypothetical protein